MHACLGESRTKGYELFIPPELSRALEDILGFSDFLYEEGKWNETQRDSFTRPTVMQSQQEYNKGIICLDFSSSLAYKAV